ncbi:hypothetical protein B0I32_1646 [Nonomuraea fuscirosea]|uniref:MFS transporter n=1 Tax=Nonomuraea fuscirosea TaxID=1291556 RepID=A0A2T0LJY1_9ACTN|nr:hypothetical protein [Nonomuraea fuscirosea]PRX42920.1 hypothetical protein B0I32_1646 [Nonomuraea fuscirosea]
MQSAAVAVSPAPPPARASAPRRPGQGLLVVICSIANGLVMADIVAASVCLSALSAAAPARQLRLAGWTWVAAGFLIFFAALLSVRGHLADRLGPTWSSAPGW